MQFVNSDDEGNNNRERIWLNYHIQGNYSLEEVEKTVSKMEAFLYANQDKFYIKQVYSYYTPGYAVSGLTLQEDLPIKVSQLKKQLKEDFPLLARAKPSFQWDQGNGGGVRLTLLGESSETLMTIADQVVPVLQNIKGMTDVKADTGNQKNELQIRIDRHKAFRFGLSANDVASIVATALRGSNLRTFRHAENGEIDIRLMFDQQLQQSLAQLRNLPVKREGAQNVTLDMLASLEIVPRLSQIERHYRQTALSIGANLEDDITLEQAKQRISAVMQHIALPTGYNSPRWQLSTPGRS